MRPHQLVRSCAIAASLLFTVASFAQSVSQAGSFSKKPEAASRVALTQPSKPLQARKLPQKRAIGLLQMPAPTKSGEPSHTGSVLVKFQDSALARLHNKTGTIYSETGADLAEATAVIYAHGAVIEPLLKVDPQVLQQIEERASNRSGKSQPDLAGYYSLKVSDGALVPLARALSSLACVEIVEIETRAVQAGSPNDDQDDGGLAGTLPACTACGDCPDPIDFSCFNAHNGGYCENAGCCNAVILLNPGCQFDWDATCVQSAVALQADDGPCATGCDACGDAACLPCDVEHKFVQYCSDGVVCTLVSGIRPSCNGAAGWDETCTALAKLLGTPSVFGTPPGSTSYDTCLQPDEAPFTPPGPYYEESVMFSGHAFQAHATGGAIIADCCREVCLIDATCCSIGWDANCAGLAMNKDNCYWTEGYSVQPIPGGGSGKPNNPYTQTQSPLFSSAMLEDAPPAGIAPGSVALALWDTISRIPDPYSGPNPPPTPPNWGNFQTFADVTLFRGGGFSMAELTEIIERFNATGAPALTKGLSVEVAVVDFSAFVNHEDFMVNGVSIINVESGVEPLLFGINDAGSGSIFQELIPAAHHGTAALGMLFAVDNLIGTTGLCTSSEPWFFPAMSTTDYNRLGTAIINGIGELSNTDDGGDPFPANVMVLPVARLADDPTGQAAFSQPLNTSDIYGEFIAVGLDAGVTIVLSAGNAGAEVLEPFAGAEAAVTTGGCWPGFQLFPSTGVGDPNAMFQSGNNYCRSTTSNYGGTVNCTGWGTAVCTLGYGDLFLGENVAVASAEEVNQLRTYTARWSGTSASACMVGGLVANLQGFAKQTYLGLGLPPDIFQAMLTNAANVIPQCGRVAAQQPGAGAITTVGDTIEYTTPPTTLCPVGGFPDARECATSVLTGNFFEDTGSTFKIVCGTKIQGNNFSVQRLDGKLLRVRSARPLAGQSSGGYGPPLNYPPSARVTDIQLTQPIVGDLERVEVNLEGRTSTSASAMVLVFIYNTLTVRWDFLGFQVMTNAAIQQLNFPLLACQEVENYLDTSGGGSEAGTVRARVVTIGSGGGFAQQQVIDWDLMEIGYNNVLIPVPPPCGG